MEEESVALPSLDLLRRQRAHRRGAITRLSKRLATLYEKTIKAASVEVGEALLQDVKLEIEKHDRIQDSIDDALADHPDALEAEYIERERHNDVNTSLIIDVRAFISQVHAYDLGRILTHRHQVFLNLHDHALQEVRDKLKAIQDLHATFCSKAALFPRSAELVDLSATVKDLIVKALAKVASTVTPASPTASAAAPLAATDRSSDRPTPSRMAPLNVDLPKFTGDPLGWANFESLFNSTLRTRTETFSEADKRSVLSTAILHPEGQRILQDDPTASVEDSIAQLRQYFGRAEVVVPLLLERMLNLSTITELFDSLQDSIQRVVRGHNSLAAHIENSLSEFLTYHIKSKLDPQISRDWQQFISKTKRPDLDNWVEFANNKICHMRPSKLPSLDSHPTSSPSVTTPTLPQPLPSSSSSSPSQPSANRPLRPRPILKCIACGETHQLNRCPTFIAFDLEKRNKMIRDRRLCINCFSDKHRCRHCPSKFSCRHCGGKHHSLLHRERETSSMTTPSTTNAAVVVDKPPTPSSPSLPPMDTAFPNTVVVSLENDHHSAKARAMFDSGAGASLMTEELATNLKLKRFPQPMSISCTSGRITSKFYVVTLLPLQVLQDQTYHLHRLTAVINGCKFPLSEYVARRVDICSSLMVKTYTQFLSKGNPSLIGFLFENVFVSLLREILKKKLNIKLEYNSSIEQWSANNVKTFDFESTSKIPQDCEWLIPTKWNQKAFDVVQFQEQRLRIVQITTAEKHDINFQTFQKLLCHFQKEKIVVNELDIVVINPPDKTTALTCKGCGQIKFNSKVWTTANIRVLRFDPNDPVIKRD